VAFSYGKLLNKYEKKLANKSTNYGKIVHDFSKIVLVPENDFSENIDSISPSELDSDNERATENTTSKGYDADDEYSSDDD
ncbi:MAG: hypothetical protein GY928_39445, partial [Colwellia sp.]|nr:hypothetical protein [Colwellia sp.]